MEDLLIVNVMLRLGINGYDVNSSDEITSFIKMASFYYDNIYFYPALLCIILFNTKLSRHVIDCIS